MAKDPALLFYTSDFITGVSDLTMEERGQLITLLCLHHQKGRLTKKLIDISVPKVSKDVMAKFSKDENSKYFNKRLELEAEKRRKHCRKQSDNATKGWDTRRAKANATAMPLENENENENEKSLLRENTKANKKENVNEVKSTDGRNDIDREELFEKLKSNRIYKNNHIKLYPRDSKETSFIEV